MGFRMQWENKQKNAEPVIATTPEETKAPRGATGSWEMAPGTPINPSAQPEVESFVKGSPEQMLAVTQPQPAPYSETQTQKTFVDPKQLANLEASKALFQEGQAELASAEAEQSKIRAAAFEEQNKAIKQKQDELDSIMQELKGSKVVDPMGQWGTARKIGAAIAMGLGAYAAAYTGGKNHAAEIIGDAIKRDIDMQEAKINKLGLDAKGAQGALADATRRLGDIAQARTAVEIAALMNAKEETLKAAQASDNKKVQANAKILESAYDSKIAELAAQLNKNVVTNTTIAGTKPGTVTEKQMTEAQGKAYNFASSMKWAEKSLQDIEEYGSTVSGAAAGLLPEAIKPEERKKFEQATSAWSEAYIRWASGANVPEKEISSTLKRALPVVGDSKEVLKQKRAYRAEQMTNLWKISGQKTTEPNVAQQKSALQFSGN